MEDRQLVISTFRTTGFQLAKDSTSLITSYLERFDTKEQKKEWIGKILEKLMNLPINSNLISVDVATKLIEEYETVLGNRHIKTLEFIDSYDVPKFLYDFELKRFRQIKDKFKLFGGGKDKGLLFIRRYQMTLQRTLRNPMFTPALDGVEYPNGKYVLNTVDYLLGQDEDENDRRNLNEDIIVLGMISDMRNKCHFLEDVTGMIRMNLSKATFNTGIYNEGSFVLASGYAENSIFHVNTIGLPPGETSEMTKEFFPTVNFFGGTTVSPDIEIELGKIENESIGAQFIILSDVFLDQIEVIQKLKVLFKGFKDDPPLLFIFMGNFISEHEQNRSPFLLKEYFGKLAQLINQFPLIAKESQFVFVPGPTDPGFVHILPRPKYAEAIIEETVNVLPNAIFASNPCRIRYCTKKILIIREEIINKMSAKALHFPKENIPENFAKTIIGQGHLLPFHLDTCPVYWNYDHVFSLYPLPDVIIVADNSDSYTVELLGSIISNPGPFMRNRSFFFKSYSCSDNSIQDCMIPEETEEETQA